MNEDSLLFIDKENVEMERRHTIFQHTYCAPWARESKKSSFGIILA